MPGKLHLSFPHEEEGLLACQHLCVRISGAASSQVPVTFPLYKVSLCWPVLFEACGCYKLRSKQGHGAQMTKFGLSIP